jgi:hypothetical protein
MTISQFQTTYEEPYFTILGVIVEEEPTDSPQFYKRVKQVHEAMVNNSFSAKAFAVSYAIPGALIEKQYPGSAQPGIPYILIVQLSEKVN